MNKFIVTLTHRGVPHQYYLEVDEAQARFYFHPTFAHREAPSFVLSGAGDALTWSGPAEPGLEAAARAEVADYLRTWKR